MSARALEVIIGLLPDCDHPTSRSICPRCIAEAVIESESEWRS